MQDLTACVAWMGSCPLPAASWPLTLKAAGQRASGKEAPALPRVDQNFTRSDTPGTEQALGWRRIQSACLPSEVPGFLGRQKWPGGQEVKVSGTSRDGSGRCRGELLSFAVEARDGGKVTEPTGVIVGGWGQALHGPLRGS